MSLLELPLSRLTHMPNRAPARVHSQSDIMQNPIRTDELSCENWQQTPKRRQGSALAPHFQSVIQSFVYSVVSFQSQLVRSSKFANRRVNIEMGAQTKVEPARSS